jgi:hypothetical protein
MTSAPPDRAPVTFLIERRDLDAWTSTDVTLPRVSFPAPAVPTGRRPERHDATASRTHVNGNLYPSPFAPPCLDQPLEARDRLLTDRQLGGTRAVTGIDTSDGTIVGQLRGAVRDG